MSTGSRLGNLCFSSTSVHLSLSLPICAPRMFHCTLMERLLRAEGFLDYLPEPFTPLRKVLSTPGPFVG